MTDRTAQQSVSDAALFERMAAEYRENMACEARFAKKVTLPDGRVGILVNGQAIAVEPQSAASWIVSALRRPRDVSGMTPGASDRSAGVATSSAVTGASSSE